VAPPRDLQITDPGLLGCLDIEWKPPASLQSFNDCTVTYKFEHHNAGDRDWKVIFTRKLKLRVGFDLSRTVEVKVQTLLRGGCTGDVEVHSAWVHATFQLPLQGKQESEVQNFHCIYHNWEYLKCTWQPGLLAPRGVHYGLYYWYEGLGQAAQCEDYIQDHGINTGCRLQNQSKEDPAPYTTDCSFLPWALPFPVELSSLHLLTCSLFVPLPAKPSPPTQLVVSMSAAEELQVAWSPPGGETPPQCLEYEVQLARDHREAKAAWMSVSTQMETALSIPRANQSLTSCVRVRGRTNILCADQGFWSDWTQECFSESRKGDKQLLILIPVILSLSSSLILFMLLGQCRKRSPAGKLPFDASVG
ncbi:Interleukin-13 receptor subunit alpha-2, partial [Dryobates pubescens]